MKGDGNGEREGWGLTRRMYLERGNEGGKGQRDMIRRQEDMGIREGTEKS